MFQKQSALERRKRRIERELTLLDDDIRTLKQCVRRPERLGAVRLKSAPLTAPEDAAASDEPARTPRAEHPPTPPQRAAANPPAGAEAPAARPPLRPRRAPLEDGDWQRFRNERLTEYLADSVQTIQPLRYERDVQRNKAIVMLVVVLLVLFWVVYRLFLM
jgi:hypothetical protein